jgi:hypothetical protein
MIRPDERVMQGLAKLARHNSDVAAWLEQAYRTELERLPYAGENSAVMQGRCQVLGELTKLIKEAPEQFGGKA